MRIGYFADGSWSHRALEKLVDDVRFQIAFIVPRFDTQDPILKKWAERLGVDYLPISNVNSSNSINQLRDYNADLFVSMSFNQILKAEILLTAPLGFINCHAGELPFYRGRNILNWALINDAKEFGVTVHYVDEGIDTGDIIMQVVEPITDRDDYSTLLERAIELCADLLFRAILEIADGTAKLIEQSTKHPVGFYCGRRVEGDEWIDWNWSSRRIFNFVRSITTPGPCARTLYNNQLIAIQRASLIDDALSYIGSPGEIVGKEGDQLVVKTGDATIRLEAYRLTSTPEASVLSFRIGQRFGVNVGVALIELMRRVSELEQRLTETGYCNGSGRPCKSGH